MEPTTVITVIIAVAVIALVLVLLGQHQKDNFKKQVIYFLLLRKPELDNRVKLLFVNKAQSVEKYIKKHGLHEKLDIIYKDERIRKLVDEIAGYQQDFETFNELKKWGNAREQEALRNEKAAELHGYLGSPFLN